MNIIDVNSTFEEVFGEFMAPAHMSKDSRDALREQRAKEKAGDEFDLYELHVIQFVLENDRHTIDAVTALMSGHAKDIEAARKRVRDAWVEHRSQELLKTLWFGRG